MDIREVRHILKHSREKSPREVKKYAVLIPMIPGAEGVEILFEVRSSALRRQPGEICFPGGGVHFGENPERAAVRETSEELLIEEGQIEVLSGMRESSIYSGGVLYPYIGQISNYRETFSEEEVAEVFRVPLDWFINNPPDIYGVRTQEHPGNDFPYDRIPDGENYHWGSRKRQIRFYQYGDRTIWGLTAGIISQFVDRLKNPEWDAGSEE